MAATVRVLSIVGSLRVASDNRWLLRVAAELAPPELTITPVGLAAMREADGRLTGDTTREHLKGFPGAFAEWTRRF